MSDEKPISTTRLTFPATVIGALLVATAVGTWAVAAVMFRIEQRLDGLSVPALNIRYYTRNEMTSYHRDLEHALQDAGLRLRFPPPRDPSFVPISEP